MGRRIRRLLAMTQAHRPDYGGGRGSGPHVLEEVEIEPAQTECLRDAETAGIDLSISWLSVRLSRGPSQEGGIEALERLIADVSCERSIFHRNWRDLQCPTHAYVPTAGHHCRQTILPTTATALSAQRNGSARQLRRSGATPTSMTPRRPRQANAPTAGHHCRQTILPVTLTAQGAQRIGGRDGPRESNAREPSNGYAGARSPDD
jgi:hypothetical protein